MLIDVIYLRFWSQKNAPSKQGVNTLSELLLIYCVTLLVGFRRIFKWKLVNICNLVLGNNFRVGLHGA